MDGQDGPDADRAEIARIAASVRSRSGVDIARLLELSLGRAMRRDRQRAAASRIAPAGYLPGELDHVGDWLASAVLANARWIDNLDGEGVPRKFSKLSSVASVVEEARRGTERMLRDCGSAGLAAGDEAVEVELADGYRLVRLLTPGALDRESLVMQHCVGLGGYDEGVAEGRIAILSLRDRFGKPHVTLEVDSLDGRVVQIKGKQNRFPLKRYFDLLVPWLGGAGLAVSPSELRGGYFPSAGQDGRQGPIRHISDVAPGEVLDGDLVLGFDGDADAPLELPPRLTVRGSLTLDMTWVAGRAVVIGRETNVTGAFTFLNAKPDGLQNLAECGQLRVVGGEVAAVAAGTSFPFPVELSSCAFGNLLETAGFTAGLTVKDCERVCFPAGAVIAGDLEVGGCGAVSLGDGLRVGGAVAISAGLEDGPAEIGRDIVIDGPLSITGMRPSIRPGLTVTGDLRLTHLRLDADLPDRMDVGGMRMNRVLGVASPAVAIPDDAVIRGHFSAVEMDLSLGGRASWTGDLRLPKCRLVQGLPDGLAVTGTLEVSHTTITRFPRRMRIGGRLVAKGCLAPELPPCARIGAGIDLAGARSIVLPDGLTVNGDLELDNAYLKAMPSGVTVLGMLRLGKVPVDRVTDHFTASSYVLSDAFVMDLSDLDYVEGDIWIRAADLSMLPAGLRVGGKMVVEGETEGASLPEGTRIGGYLAATSLEMPGALVPPSATVGGGFRSYHASAFRL